MVANKKMNNVVCHAKKVMMVGGRDGWRIYLIIYTQIFVYKDILKNAMQ